MNPESKISDQKTKCKLNILIIIKRLSSKKQGIK